MNMKKTKKFKENRPENYHVHDIGLARRLTVDLTTDPVWRIRRNFFSITIST